MSTCKTVKTWEKTKVQGLVKHRSGGYYSRLFIGGKERWVSMKTKVLEVAKIRLRDEQRNAGKTDSIARPAKSGRMTMGMAIEQLNGDINARVPMRRKGRKQTITASSGHYREETIEALKRTWGDVPGYDLATSEVRKISAADCRKWADVHREKYSATRFNNTLGTLRRLFDIAIAAGELGRNPATDIGRSYKEPKATYTPTLAELAKIIETIRQSPSTKAGSIADFVEFLSYTGSRKEAASLVTWGDVDFQRETITFRKTKNGRVLIVQAITPALELLRRMRDERGECAPDERVFSVSEAYGSLRRAAKEIGIPRISHHDLRDVFATTAIESGVDIPTVADWLGHLDGGKLLLETYRKHRDEHARQSAKKVSFTPAPPAENIISIAEGVA